MPADDPPPPTADKQITSAILVQNIEAFASGDFRKVENFINAIEHAQKIGAWTEEQVLNVAILKLKNEALECFNTAVGTDTWAKLKTLLKTRFGRKEPRCLLRHKFNNCQQRPGEDPMAFSQRLKSLHVQVDPELGQASQDVRDKVAQTLLDRFLYGLKDSIRTQVLLSKPKEWNDAIETAQYIYEIDELAKSNKQAKIHMLQDESDASKGNKAKGKAGANAPVQSKEPQWSAGPPATQPRRPAAPVYSQPNPRSYQTRPPAPPQFPQAYSNLPRNYQNNNAREPGYANDVVCYQCNQRGHYRRECPTLNYRGRPDRSNAMGNQRRVSRCPVCSAVRWHQVDCPAATPVTQTSPYNPPVQRKIPEN